MPAMALTNVDFPAPLSPTRATTSPGRTSKSTSLSAWTGPKLLLTPFSVSRAPFAFISWVPFCGAEGRRRPGAAGLHSGLLRNAQGLARRGVRARADLRGRPVAVLDDGVLDVVLRHRGDVEGLRRDLLVPVVLLVGGE